MLGGAAVRVLLGMMALMLLNGCGKKVKGEPQRAARTFLEQVERGETDAAYQSASFDFRAQLNQAAFTATARELGLVGAKLVSLEPAEVTTDSAKLNATVKPELTEPRQLVVTVQPEDGAWRVFSIKTPRNPKTGNVENLFSLVGRTRGFAEGQTRALPSEEETRKLVKESMAQFAEALKRKSFDDFYNQVSKAWQAQLTKGQLQRAFQAFIDQQVDLGGTSDVEPIFETNPQMTMDGLLQVSGYYPTKPFEVKFAFKYAYELPEWKLFGLDVYLRRAGAKPPEVGPAPAPAGPK
jgi:hypothetical protein